MAKYEIGFIFGRCFLQKPLALSAGAEAIPLGRTGWKGEIHNARALLSTAGFDFTRTNLDRTVANFDGAGHCVLIRLPAIEANSFMAAIGVSEPAATAAASSLSVLSSNPALPLCAYAKAPGDAGVKFFFPSDRQIQHASNIAGFLDAVPAIEERALEDPKFALLLRLFRASLREPEIDYQLLFQLILFEEASDGEDGSLAERLRRFSDKHGFAGDLNAVANECGLTLPEGKDMVDVIVKLRNAAAHNGKIDEESLKEYNGSWVIPLLADKLVLHKAVCETIRYMFCALVGHTRDAKATLVTDSITMKFD